MSAVAHDHVRLVFGCDGCIARANVGMTIEGGAKVFRVEAEKTLMVEFYVVAASPEQARRDADAALEDFSSSDWDTSDDSSSVIEIDGLPEGEVAWVGGPKGGWE